MLAGTTGVAGAHSASALSQAKKELLVLSDMPKGWKSTKSSNDNSSFPGAAQLASCLGVPTSVITDNPPSANSPEFDSKNQLQSVDDSVSVYPSAKAARADFASLANSNTPSCLTTVLNGTAKSALVAQFGPKASVGNITVSRFPATALAPHNANFVAFMPVTTQGVTLNVELIVVDFVRATVEQTVTMTSVQNPFPTSLAKHLSTVASGRL
jgi:hypothetical protein